MDYSYEFEINAPIEFVFNVITDVSRIEGKIPSNVVMRNIQKNGGEELALGDIWRISTTRGGRKLTIENEITRLIAPRSIIVSSESNRLKSVSELSLSATSAEQTVLHAKFEVNPKGLLGRILVQSLKASRKRVEAALDRGSLRLSEYIEDLYDGVVEE